MTSQETQGYYDYISKTVYALYYPETDKLIRELYQGEEIYRRHEKAYTKKQDTYHLNFKEAYLNWTNSVLNGLKEYNNFYPASGSSEAIREVIAHIGNNYRGVNKVIHMFEGEYEGYKAYADEHKVYIKYWGRENYTHSLKEYIYDNCYNTQNFFFLSEPSAIDGNLWSGYKSFIDFVTETFPNDLLKLAVDLAYVGCVEKDYTLDLSSPNIKYVFVSLSKAFGTYYRRIGGVFSRENLAGLWGNQWFKNLDSLYIGENLMGRYPVRGEASLPGRYSSRSGIAVNNISSKLGISRSNIKQSDVVILANIINDSNFPLRDEMRRVKGKSESRICITPALDKLVSPE